MLNLIQPIKARRFVIIVSLSLALNFGAGSLSAAPPAEVVARVPVLGETSWKICVMPDLGELAGPDPRRQHIVDHGFLPRPDGSWLLWACLRGTHPGRILFGWEGGSLAKGPWKPLGVAARAEAAWGEKTEPQESIQAPHFLQHGDEFLCFYNSNGIRLMTSHDGARFARRGSPPDGNLLYADGGRDVMVLPIDGVFHAYSTVSTTDGRGYVALRTSRDLKDWTPLRIVCEGGRGGTGPISAESPFVVHLDGYYYLFRASSNDGQTYVYRSERPDDFGVNDDSRLIARLPLKAPEIIHHQGRWYVSDLGNFQAILLRELRWEASAK